MSQLADDDVARHRRKREGRCLLASHRRIARVWGKVWPKEDPGSGRTRCNLLRPIFCPRRAGLT
jgi:hypothetical protein